MLAFFLIVGNFSELCDLYTKYNIGQVKIKPVSKYLILEPIKFIHATQCQSRLPILFASWIQFFFGLP